MTENKTAGISRRSLLKGTAAGVAAQPCSMHIFNLRFSHLGPGSIPGLQFCFLPEIMIQYVITLNRDFFFKL
ncbi:MAG: twin-arginine translocation signal domain-containing protein [Pseudomonadota bacterium]